MASFPFLALVTLAGGAVALLLAFLLDLPPFFAVLASGGLAAIFLYLRAPLMLLASLIVVRMSLDYSAEFFLLSVRDIQVSLSQLFGAGIAVLGLLLLFQKGREVRSFPLLPAFLLVIVWGTGTLLYSIDRSETLTELFRVFGLFTLGFLAFVSVETRSDAKRLLQASFLSALVPIAFSLYQFVFSIGFTDVTVSIPRIFGTFSHPNILSLFLFTEIVLAILYLRIFAESAREKWLVSGLLGIFALILFLTFARVAWLSLFVFLFLLGLVSFRRLLVPLILLPAVLYAFSPAFQERVSQSFETTPDSSIVWRQTLWNDLTLKTIQDGRALQGSGMDTFPIVSESLRGEALGSNDPHNDFVKFFVEGGAIGVLVLSAYIFLVLFALVRHFLRNKNRPELRTAFAFLILLFLTLEFAALSDNIFKNTPVAWLFFTASGAFFALSRKPKA